MKKSNVLRVLLAAVIYLALFPAGSACGLIHPACYAYVGTVLPLLFSFVYLLAAANMRCFGATAVLNGVLLIAGLATGEGDLAFVLILIALTITAELIRKLLGYDTLKGVRWSFLPFAFSFYAYAAHWWTNTADALAAAVEEMPVGYADKMEPVIQNIPILILMLVLTIPVAVLGMFLAEKVLEKQTALLR